jgi:hypothetical protein
MSDQQDRLAALIVAAIEKQAPGAIGAMGRGYVEYLAAIAAGVTAPPAEPLPAHGRDFWEQESQRAEPRAEDGR